MKRKDSNFVGILSDQGEAATASNLSENTIAQTVSFQKMRLVGSSAWSKNREIRAVINTSRLRLCDSVLGPCDLIFDISWKQNN